MGRFPYFPGIKIIPCGKDIIFSQQKYILELLEHENLSKVNPMPTTNVVNANISLGGSCPLDDLIQYRQIVGALWYVTLS